MWNISYPQVWFTFGPQTNDVDVLTKLIAAGATGVRLTFSYGTPQLQVERAGMVRDAARRAGHDVCIVADLQGEKCRFAKIDGVEEISVSAGQSVLLTTGDADPFGCPPRLPVQIPSYLDGLTEGDVILEGDGAMTLRVEGRHSMGIMCTAERAGVLHPGRGLLVRTPNFHPAALTKKDRQDLAAIAEARVFDVVAISFVSDETDVLRTRELLADAGVNIPILAKIETQLGVNNIDSILAVADAVMAARGDLALTMPWVELPQTVLTIAEAASANNKPWILATQLAEGLERFVFPTRPEICDLAHWMNHGAFGAMASYETAFGPRPIDTVECVAALVSRYRKDALAS